MGAIDTIHEELLTASKILEWENGDIVGHVGARLPDNGGIAIKLFRPPADQEGVEDWLVHFNFALEKLEGVGTIPMESTIYTGIFKARPDVNAVIHAHSPMCIALSLVDRPVAGVHLQSAAFGMGLPIYPRPIFIVDEGEGDDLARALGQAPGITIKGHGIVTVGRSIDEAVNRAMYMERTAKIIAMAALVGYQGPTRAFREEMEGSQRRSAARGRAMGTPQLAHSVHWTYYTEKVKRGETWTRGPF